MQSYLSWDTSSDIPWDLQKLMGYIMGYVMGYVMGYIGILIGDTWGCVTTHWYTVIGHSVDGSWP